MTGRSSICQVKKSVNFVNPVNPVQKSFVFKALFTKLRQRRKIKKTAPKLFFGAV
jgi:hypothetical protein